MRATTLGICSQAHIDFVLFPLIRTNSGVCEKTSLWMLVVQPPSPSPVNAMLTNAGEDSMSPETAVHSIRDWHMPQLCIPWGGGGMRDQRAH